MTIRDRIEKTISDKDITLLNVSLDVLLNSGNGEAMFAAMEDVMAVLRKNYIRNYQEAIDDYRTYGKFIKGRTKVSAGLHETLGAKVSK